MMPQGLRQRVAAGLFNFFLLLAACDPVSNAATLSPLALTAPPFNPYTIIPDIAPDFETPPEATDQPPVMIYSVEKLMRLYAYSDKPLPPDEISLAMLTDRFSGWKPVYLHQTDFVLDDTIVLAAGLLDNDLVVRVREGILATGFELAKVGPGEGYVALIKDTIPDHYPTEEVVINWRTRELVLYPLYELATELNVPAFRWRIYQLVDGQRIQIVDWPVVVGRPNKRTPIIPFVVMDQIEHYPSWTDPETGRYVGPGTHNPLGIWKLKSSSPHRRWYYHGTNQPKLLGRDWRAFSHGCIRNANENIRRLALFLLSHNAGEELRPGLVTGRIDVIPEKRTRVVPLVRGVQARNHYDTIEVLRRDPVEKSSLVFYPNVYWVGGENDVYRLTTLDHLRETIAALGILPEKLDEAKAAALVTQMRKIRLRTEVPVGEVVGF